jgi:HSP20 family protein
MTTLLRPVDNPLAELVDWFGLNRPASLSDLTHFIPVESFTDQGRYVVRADLPGVDPEQDIEVEVEGDVLTIRGERQETQHTSGHSEFRYGSFTRSLRLPQGCHTEDVTARYEAGVLEVSVAVPETPAEPVKIAVTRDEGSPS